VRDEKVPRVGEWCQKRGSNKGNKLSRERKIKNNGVRGGLGCTHGVWGFSWGVEEPKNEAERRRQVELLAKSYRTARGFLSPFFLALFGFTLSSWTFLLVVVLMKNQFLPFQYQVTS
jgi:hypothetical protein